MKRSSNKTKQVINFWNIKRSKGKVKFQINFKHPMVINLLEQSTNKNQIKSIFRSLEQNIPIGFIREILEDYEPDELEVDKQKLYTDLSIAIEFLRKNKMDDAMIKEELKYIEPFSNNYLLVEEYFMEKL